MGHSLIRDSFGQFSRGFVRLGEVATTSFFDPSSLYRLRNNGIDGINLGLATEPAQRFDRYAEVVCCKWKRHKYTEWRKISSMEIRVVGITQFHFHHF